MEAGIKTTSMCHRIPCGKGYGYDPRGGGEKIPTMISDGVR